MAILFINFLYNKIMNFEKLLQMNSKSLIQDTIFPDSINSKAADFENFTSQATTYSFFEIQQRSNHGWR